jgi:hypothetical protein
METGLEKGQCLKAGTGIPEKDETAGSIPCEANKISKATVEATEAGHVVETL